MPRFKVTMLTTLALFVLAVAASTASAAASLTPLGINTLGNGVSGDGSVVVGISPSDNAWGQAFRWTAAGGIQGLGRPPGHFYSYARAVNADGSVVVGGSQFTDGVSEFTPPIPPAGPPPAACKASATCRAAGGQLWPWASAAMAR